MERTAEILKNRKTEIISIWEKVVKEEIYASKNTNSLALRDHLPDLLDDMHNILQRFEHLKVIEKKEGYETLFKHSSEHGRHRSSSAGYTVDQILREYILFHEVITNLLMEEGVYTTEASIAIKYAVENAMIYSVSAYNDSIQEMRQKLLGVLVHDLRNPISAAYFSLDIMNYEEGRERFEKVKTMAFNSLKRANELMEDLLDTIAVEAGEGMVLEFSEINIADFIHSVHGEASEIYTNEVKLHCVEDEITGIFDGAMIRRLLENLLSNAVKYGDRKAPISILVDNEKEKVTLSVHNHGNPIPEDAQKEIFQFLYTTHGNRHKGLKSWGMGLTLVKAVAEAHGGKLSLESSEEKGTVFSIVLDKFKNTPGKKRASLNFSY